MTLAKKISPEKRVRDFIVSATETELLKLQQDISLVMSLRFYNAALPATKHRGRPVKVKELPEATA